jgi:hypothetical protein
VARFTANFRLVLLKGNRIRAARRIGVGPIQTGGVVMSKSNVPFHIIFLVALAMAVTPLAGRAQPQVEVYSLGGIQEVGFDTQPANTLPVLFVQGHNPVGDNDLIRIYKKNWVDPSMTICLFPLTRRWSATRSWV